MDIFEQPKDEPKVKSEANPNEVAFNTKLARNRQDNPPSSESQTLKDFEESLVSNEDASASTATNANDKVVPSNQTSVGR